MGRMIATAVAKGLVVALAFTIALAGIMLAMS